MFNIEWLTLNPDQDPYAVSISYFFFIALVSVFDPVLWDEILLLWAFEDYMSPEFHTVDM